MKRSTLPDLVTAAAVWVFLTTSVIAPATSANTNAESHRFWKPVPDEVYLQEMGQKITSDKPVTSVAAYKDSVFVVAGGTMKALRDGVLGDAPGAPAGVKRLRFLGGALWAAAENGTYRFTGDAWARVAEKPLNDFCVHLGKVHGAASDEIFRFEDGKFVSLKPAGGYLQNDTTMIMEDGTQVLTDPVEIGPVERIASYSGTLYLLRRAGLALLICGQTSSRGRPDEAELLVICTTPVPSALAL